MKDGVEASSTTPLAIHFSSTDKLIRLAAAKSCLDIVGEVASVTALFTASFTASLMNGIKITATLAINLEIALSQMRSGCLHFQYA